jgi:hypothetical protein
MHRTIRIGAHRPARGIAIRGLGDGRIVIDAGHVRLFGHPATAGDAPASQVTSPGARPARHWQEGIFGRVSSRRWPPSVPLWGPAPAAAQESEGIPNVSCETARELDLEHNELFNAWWTRKGARRSPSRNPTAAPAHRRGR